MEPSSLSLLVVLFAAAAALLVAVAVLHSRTLRVLAGVLTVLISAVGGMAVVNDYYGYYQTWSQLSTDLSGNYAAFATASVSRTEQHATAGRVVAIPMPGRLSHIRRGGLVYLPPQYGERRYAHYRFPVVELLHGTPGTPENWVVQLDIARVADQLIANHEMGPMVLVMPTMSVGRQFEECVNAPGALDDTYITRDVRTDIEARFRVSRVPAQWGVAGYSSGGYCAANLALRHPAYFGASAIMDGYFRPQDGPAAAALHFNAAAEASNDPLLEAEHLTTSSAPLPAFWLSAGTGDAADFAGARAFVAALHGVERVTLHREPDAGHNFYAWRSADPRLLAWMWGELASPQQRADYPIAGPAQNVTIPSTQLDRRGARTSYCGRHIGACRPGHQLRPRTAHGVLASGRRRSDGSRA